MNPHVLCGAIASWGDSVKRVVMMVAPRVHCNLNFLFCKQQKHTVFSIMSFS